MFADAFLSGLLTLNAVWAFRELLGQEKGTPLSLLIIPILLIVASLLLAYKCRKDYLKKLSADRLRMLHKGADNHEWILGAIKIEKQRRRRADEPEGE